MREYNSLRDTVRIVRFQHDDKPQDAANHWASSREKRSLCRNALVAAGGAEVGQTLCDVVYAVNGWQMWLGVSEQ
ncbi:hypothetical protein AB1N83_013477 [Pleurotus pulmonarius]